MATFKVGDLVVPKNKDELDNIKSYVRNYLKIRDYNGEPLEVAYVSFDSGPAPLLYFYVENKKGGPISDGGKYETRFELYKSFTKEELLIRKIRQLWERQEYVQCRR